MDAATEPAAAVHTQLDWRFWPPSGKKSRIINIPKSNYTFLIGLSEIMTPARLLSHPGQAQPLIKPFLFWRASTPLFDLHHWIGLCRWALEQIWFVFVRSYWFHVRFLLPSDYRAWFWLASLEFRFIASEDRITILMEGEYKGRCERVGYMCQLLKFLVNRLGHRSF